MKIKAFLTVILFTATASHAARMYVLETAEIGLKEGPGSEYRYVASVSAGAEVEVAQEKLGWSRLVSPAEGWLPSGKLTGQAPSYTKLSETLAENERLKAELQKLSESAGKAGQELGAAATGKAELEQKLSGLEREYAEWKKQNSNVVKLREEADAARARAEDAENLAQRLISDKEKSDKWANALAMIAGALILIGGYVAGGFYSSGRRHGAGKIRF